MLELQVQKRKHTCAVLDGTVYYPTPLNERTDQYHLPCDDGTVHTLEVIHYSGSSPDGVFCLLDDSKRRSRQVVHEMVGLETRLFYCRLRLTVLAEKGARLCYALQQISHMDGWGKTQYCDLHLRENQGVRITGQERSYYPSRRVKNRLAVMESGSAILNVVLFAVAVAVALGILLEGAMSAFTILIFLAFCGPIFLALLLLAVCRAVRSTRQPGPTEQDRRRARGERGHRVTETPRKAG
ncbi:MAG: hypothetical protein IJ133_05620 [Clostridia bacterium]|nr:hypothetical protein [Clostridia bacterium]